MPINKKQIDGVDPQKLAEILSREDEKARAKAKLKKLCAKRKRQGKPDKMAPRGVPFKPGVSGNPAGRKPGVVSISAALLKRLRKNPAIVDEMVSSLITEFKSGNGPVVKQVWDRIDGPVPQEVNVDMSRFTNEELDVLERIATKITNA